MRRDEIGGGIKPDVAIDGALGVRETVDESDEGGTDIVAVSLLAARIASRSEMSGAKKRSRADSRSRISASVMGSAS